MLGRKSIFFILLMFISNLAIEAKIICFGQTRQVGKNEVCIQFYSPSIVRVRIYPKELKNISRKSYSVILAPGQDMHQNINITELQGVMELSSSKIKVDLDINTGNICFYDANDHLLINAGSFSIVPCSHAVDIGKYKISQTFHLEKDELIYGLGQLRDTAMNQRNRHIELWNHNTYISIPYFMSERGYGIYWDNSGKSYFDDNQQGTTFSSEVGPYIDYYFFYNGGSADGVIASIRELTGQATMFPLWSMGYWQSRERYKTSDELIEVLDKYRQLKIPLDVIVQDWQYWGCDSNWNAMSFMNPYYINKVNDPSWKRYLPNDMENLPLQKNPRIKSPEEMVKYVHDQHAHLMISIWASFGPWTKLYKDLKSLSALYPFNTWPRNQGVMIYDVFNPKARDIYWHYLLKLYNMGMDAWWTDSSEPDHFEKPGDDDYMTNDGSWRSVKNAFPLLHNKGIYEHQRAMKGNRKRSLQMTRSGTFGIQHYGTFSWSGDVVASWEEMRNQIPSGLNYTLCGIPFWSTDLGGFFYWQFEQTPKNPALQELQTRWMEWGTFMPIMRNHCSSPMVDELYLFGKKGDWAYDAILKYIKLRYKLLPYIYSNAADCVFNNGSMMRALIMDFHNDKYASRLNNEYLFGHNLLVKPVTVSLYTWKDSLMRGHEIYPDVGKAAAPINVYLPKGTDWYDFWTNECISGGRNIQRLCPIDIMPVYVKAGTIIPFGPDVQYSNEKPWDNLEIRVYPGADGSFTLYEDEGDNYNYEKGKYSQIKFVYNDGSHTLIICSRKGSFKGMLRKRRFRVLLINKNSSLSEQERFIIKNVEYNGKHIVINLT